MGRSFIVTFILQLLALQLNSEHHYHVESLLSTDATRKLIMDYGGVILTELQFTGRPSFFVSFTEYIPSYTTRAKRRWLQLNRAKRTNPREFGIHRHPGISLTYQPKLRVSKREEYNCFLNDVFDPFYAELKLNGTDKPERLPLTPLDKKILKMHAKLHAILALNDPAAKYAKQYINDGTGVSPLIGYDINVYPAYALGYNGSGIRVSIVDDGMDYTHCDLKGNYDANISTNLVEPQKTLSSPRPPGKLIERSQGHGTQCAGLVAATANNSRCSHGVAYGASIGAVRLLGDTVTDSLESEAFSYKLDLVDIYCVSWGPTDDGMTIDVPRRHTLNSIQKAWKKGRGGKGAIYVFASGNGGLENDNCGADGFVGRPEIISVGALDANGNKAKYAESCASLRCSVPVGGLGRQADMLPSVEANNGCMMDFAGTSAAAPLAAGCFALTLQANPNITQRDLDHLIVWSTRLPNNVNQDWVINAAGHMHSIHVGFGLLDCTRMVVLAKIWNSVGRLCIVRSGLGRRAQRDWSKRQAAVPSSKHFHHVNQTIHAVQYMQRIRDNPNRLAFLSTVNITEVEISITEARGLVNGYLTSDSCQLYMLEKVVVHVQWQQLCRGITEIQLQSPAGTRTTLLSYRAKDIYNGPTNMTFTSVAHFGEKIKGKWTVMFKLGGKCGNPVVQDWDNSLRGVINHVDLEFWGTEKGGDSFARNENLLKPLRSTATNKASKSKRGRSLEDHEVAKQYQVQRSLAYKFTQAVLQERYPPNKSQEKDKQ